MPRADKSLNGKLSSLNAINLGKSKERSVFKIVCFHYASMTLCENICFFMLLFVQEHNLLSIKSWDPINDEHTVLWILAAFLQCTLTLMAIILGSFPISGSIFVLCNLRRRVRIVIWSLQGLQEYQLPVACLRSYYITRFKYFFCNIDKNLKV